jgi:oligoribonuclease NrnB/cAMP/cGMP phosphodiesterase (DHH superfamily)
MKSRIITRPDFDGIVCAALIREGLGQNLPICWAQPNDVQNDRINVSPDDIIANLPLSGECALWFDHHISNAVKRPYKGIYRVAPSAAGLIYEYFHASLSPRFDTLVAQADKIDDAQLNLDEILHPERYPYILVSMTTSAGSGENEAYWNHMVELLRTASIEQILKDPQVKLRCNRVIAENKDYETHLKRYTRVQQAVSITDFRDLDPVPNGNRFLVYSLFPESFVNMKIFHEKNKTAIKIGHSIINRTCKVNVGGLLARYGGGGHRGAGACRLNNTEAQIKIPEILQILIGNQPN